MAGNNPTTSYYIQHHLQNLTFGHHPSTVGASRIPPTRLPRWDSGHCTSTPCWSVGLGLLFLLLFRKVGRAATTGVPTGLQNFVE